MPCLTEEETVVDPIKEIRSKVIEMLDKFSGQELCSSDTVCDDLLDILLLTDD